MTSKEIIEDEIKVLEHKLLIYEMDNNKPKINILKTEIETKDIVLKDLEVLEILKQLAKGVIELKNNNIDITKYVVLISESTNDKIKNWLEKRDKNEKN